MNTAGQRELHDIRWPWYNDQSNHDTGVKEGFAVKSLTNVTFFPFPSISLSEVGDFDCEGGRQ